jgi:hypothetical protein
MFDVNRVWNSKILVNASGNGTGKVAISTVIIK